jgi:hypothetical protein
VVGCISCRFRVRERQRYDCIKNTRFNMISKNEYDPSEQGSRYIVHTVYPNTLKFIRLVWVFTVFHHALVRFTIPFLLPIRIGAFYKITFQKQLPPKRGTRKTRNPTSDR